MSVSEPIVPPGGSIAYKRVGEDVHVTMTGAIDMTSGTEAAGDTLFATETDGEIVVDVSDVTFIDSIGLTTLLRLRHYAGRGVRLVRPSESVSRILDVSGTASLFVIDG